MIIDTLSLTARYAALHPLFPQAFDFLANASLASLPPGRISIVGERLYVSIDHVTGRGREGARLEAHRRYVDIQVTIAGNESIGWKPLAHCKAPDGPFDSERDIGFFAERPDTWLAVPENHFAIFFPDDVHAPLAGVGALRKAIMKVAL
jgi:YhcH/YjgK/YiaL family protein